MKACGARLQRLPRRALEAIAVGEVECEECEVEMAQTLLRELERREYRERQAWLEARGQVRLCE